MLLENIIHSKRQRDNRIAARAGGGKVNCNPLAEDEVWTRPNLPMSPSSNQNMLCCLRYDRCRGRRRSALINMLAAAPVGRAHAHYTYANIQTTTFVYYIIDYIIITKNININYLLYYNIAINATKMGAAVA